MTIGSTACMALSKLNTYSESEVYSSSKLFYITAFIYLTSKLQALKDNFYKHWELADNYYSCCGQHSAGTTPCIGLSKIAKRRLHLGLQLTQSCRARKVLSP